MRTFLLVFGWASFVGSICDGVIAIMLLGLTLFQSADPAITVDTHLREHLPFLYWIRAVAEAVMPVEVVRWIFGLPALIYFPARVVMSVILGGWALRAAAGIKQRRLAYQS
jgi:hypothetical protein